MGRRKSTWWLLVGVGSLSMLIVAAYAGYAAEDTKEKGEPSVSPTALSPEENAWLTQTIAVARTARERAYAPYSKFRMGAAVRTDKGTMTSGALVENVSLGLSMCAERVALFSTVAQNAGKPKLLVLVAPRTDGHLTFPCGACLQVAHELGGPDLHVEACDTKGVCKGARLGDLAPHLPHKTHKK
ncbi:MAG: cytidine deaminase [Candidatus Binatia bacterium]